jgi:hypothetical protein
MYREVVCDRLGQCERGVACDRKMQRTVCATLGRAVEGPLIHRSDEPVSS